ncbi:MAG: hypothetical protein JWR04_1997 [Rhodoglobus sp.]|jgi:hypothetical protein|nr:hypothetical protein [Rhodoglobus sp.]
MTRSKTGVGRRSLTFDPRLAIGLALVAGSVAGVVALVSAADTTTEVLAAGEHLAPGERIDRDDLVVLDVRLGAAADNYLVPAKVPAEGLVVSRSVGEGELVPLAAVGRADSERLAPLVLEVHGSLAASVQPGTRVDVWAAPELEGGRFGPPAVIAGGATVVRLVTSDSIVSASETTAVELLVPKSRIARVLEAAANADALSIVPAAIPVR